MSIVPGEHGVQNSVSQSGIEIVKCQQCKLVFQPRSDSVTASDYRNAPNRDYDSLQAVSDVIQGMKRLKPTGKLLDVGCGRGEFLARIQEEGYDATGLEPDVTGCDIVSEQLGLKVIHGYYSKELFSENSFDVHTYIQLLEHCADPLNMLRASFHHLRPGGLLVITVPS